MRSCPVDGKNGGFEELFVRIFLADILAGEIGFSKLLEELLVSGDQLFLCIARVVHEGIILRGESVT